MTPGRLKHISVSRRSARLRPGGVLVLFGTGVVDVLPRFSHAITCFLIVLHVRSTNYVFLSLSTFTISLFNYEEQQ